MRIRFLVTVAALGLLAGGAHANSVNGVPVVAIGNSTQAIPTCPSMEGSTCYNSSSGSFSFFVPLSTAQGGVFGVTPNSGGTAGTHADSGSGASNTLTMFLMFSPVTLPVSTASLTFSFIDLDLSGINDPNGFFETIQFYDSNGTAISPTITGPGSGGGSGTYLNYTVTGNSTSQTIFFSNVTTIVQNPFFVQLTFGSQYTRRATNTAESLTATLAYTNPPPAPPVVVPEPSSMLLMASGLVGIGRMLRRKKQ